MLLSVAQWICLADPVCSTALDYYNQYCRSMFAGKKCTLRCKNSISILRRQVPHVLLPCYLATLLPLVTLWLSLEVIVYSISARFKALASFNISLYLLGTLLPGYPLAFCGIDTLLDGFFYVPVLLKSWILSLVVLHVATLLLWY